MKYLKLSEIAHLTAGVIIRRIISDTNEDKGFGKITILSPKAFSAGKIDYSLLSSEFLNDELSVSQERNFLAYDGDIIMKFSSPYDACRIFLNKDEKLLVPSFCCRIRIRPESPVTPDFLVCFLNSKKCKEELTSRCHTLTMALTKKSDLEKIEVPVLPMTLQETIVKRANNISNMEDLIFRLKELEEERNTQLFEGMQL